MFAIIRFHLPYCRETLKKEFVGQLQVIRPANPSLAVLRGAVMFALNEEAIQSRVMGNTYGTSFSREFTNAHLLDGRKSHPVRRGDRVKQYCDNIFKVFVKVRGS